MKEKKLKMFWLILKVLANPKDKVSLKRIEKLGKGRFAKFLEFQKGFKYRDQQTIEILDNVIKATDYLIFVR